MSSVDNFQCTDCGTSFNSHIACPNCHRLYSFIDNVLVAWPKDMASLAIDEAEHHDHDDGHATEVHQLNRPRNWFYHEKLWQTMRQLPKGAEILEVGAGTGWDAQKLMGEYRLTLSDVSPQTLARLSKKLNDPNIIYVAADGSRLPFTNESFAGVYMVATLHHLPDVQKSVAEFARVLKPGGQLMIAIEPNFTYFYFIKKLRGLFCRLTHMDPHEGSHADAEMEGFTYTELQKLFSGPEWHKVEIKPVWLFAGWWHYLAEVLFRALRLKKRLALPAAVEWMLIYLDEWLFKIPGVKHLGWHWTIRATKV